MYKQDGQTVIPYGRRAPGVNKIEFSDLEHRLIALEARVAELETEKDHDPQEDDKPKRGRKPKEATE